ncbi:MAG: D-alanyl-D-alanine carboxypeptidase family protein [Anaerovoracaceae bacterium]
MKKKIMTSCFVAALLVTGFMGVSRFSNPQAPLNIETVGDTMGQETKNGNSSMDIAAKGAILIDAGTGKVLYEQDSHKELPPASVTKIMTMLLVMEAVEDGKISLKDTVTISERAASMGGSQMYMEPGEQHSLEEIMEGIAIVSANDACVAAAEYVSGNEEIFVEQMNKRAKELGMRDTNFVNTNGLPVAEHYTSAYDIALMSRLLIEHKETSKWFNTWQTTIKVGLPGKEKEFGLTNTNKLIKFYPGANGIKTGFTAEAGYCLSGSATKNDTTLIAVVLGAESAKIRNGEIAELFNYGFASYQSVEVAKQNQPMKKVEILSGEPFIVNAVSKDRVTALVKKGEEETIKTKIEINKKIKVPMKAGTEIGKLMVYVQKEKVGEYPLVVEKKVDKTSFVKYYIRKIKELI